jgi:hypothetical protein
MGTLVRSSKMCRPKGGPWPINSFWIPRTYAVRNPFVVFRHVVERMQKMLEVESQVSTGNLTRLLEGDADITFLQSDSTKILLPRNSVDYVIIDPPHTSEVQYFELSSFYTSWLGKKLDYKNELTINSKQGKDIETYMKMLTRASLGICSSLKNGGYYTVILHGADSRVLDRCVDAICDAGFGFLEKRKVDGYTVYTFKKSRQGLRKWPSSS